MPNFTAFGAIILYLASAAFLLQFLQSKSLSRKKAYIGLFIAAIGVHILSLSYTVFPNQQLNLSFFKAASLIFCAMSIIAIASQLKNRPIQNLILIMLPSAAVSIALAQWMPNDAPKTLSDRGLITHIVLSILAYAIITIASLQAVLIAAQENQLRHHQFKGLFQYLPPLQTMESLLFEMIWLGFALLTLAIASGAVFLDDIFAQHLAHKTVLSIIAWFIFAALLLGRHINGWRGKTATHWTIAGFIALMLAYFGSKFVLEFVLGRV